MINISKLAILCDFDGTITRLDIAVQILSMFAKSDWKKYDIGFRNGEISLEECLGKQYALVNTPPNQILLNLTNKVKIRPNFKMLVDYCFIRRIPFVIVSAGIDFIIHHVLQHQKISYNWKIYAPKSKFSNNGYEFTFPRIFNPKARDFKEDCVLLYQSNNYHVIFIGDSRGDFNAIETADSRYVIKNSILANLCRSNNIEVKEFIDFIEVINSINNSDQMI